MHILYNIIYYHCDVTGNTSFLSWQYAKKKKKKWGGSCFVGNFSNAQVGLSGRVNEYRVAKYVRIIYLEPYILVAFIL